jgi:hypothetical protein
MQAFAHGKLPALGEVWFHFYKATIRPGHGNCRLLPPRLAHRVTNGFTVTPRPTPSGGAFSCPPVRFPTAVVRNRQVAVTTAQQRFTNAKAALRTILPVPARKTPKGPTRAPQQDQGENIPYYYSTFKEVWLYGIWFNALSPNGFEDLQVPYRVVRIVRRFLRGGMYRDDGSSSRPHPRHPVGTVRLAKGIPYRWGWCPDMPKPRAAQKMARRGVLILR